MPPRGKNITEREKALLLNIVEKYKHIIENKTTNAITAQKKLDVWELVTNSFNSESDYSRSLKQLQIAYANMKRMSRKDVANKNVQDYLTKKSKPQNNDLKNIEELNKIYINFKKEESLDKKAIKATGGGSFQPKLSEAGAQVLAILGDQIKPLRNNNDSAAAYFSHDKSPKNEEITTSCCTAVSNEFLYEVIEVEESDNRNCAYYSDQVDEYGHTAEGEAGSSQMNSTSPIDVSKDETPMTQTKKPSLKRKWVSKSGKPKIFNTNKNNYYKTKFETALIEKKTKMLEYKVAQKKFELLNVDAQIKKAQLEKILHS